MPKRKSTFTRRQVIRQGMAGVAAASAVGPALGAKGANDRIRVAVTGIHGRGKSHIGAYSSMKNEGVEIAYLVDPDSSLFDSRANDIEKKTGKRPKCVQDIREVLNDKSVDAVSIATPNHWHSLITVWACQAGKDVYVEKPMSHNIFEGRKCIEAARKYKRIVQHGTQRRSDGGWWKVVAAIKSGKLGKLLVARGLCYKPGGGGNTRGDIGFRPVKEPPAGFNWDLWQGPAQALEYHENLVHYRWHWFLATGNGDLGNQGAHQMDVARWCIPNGKMPKSCIAFGGRIGHYDQGTAASTHMAIMDYGETKLIFETRGLKNCGDYKGQRIGNVLHCEAGDIVEKKFFPKGSDKEAPLPDVPFEMGPGGGNFGNFMAAVRSRKVSDLNAGVEEGHYSAALCHLANISYVLGNKLPFEPAHKVFEADEDAMDVYNRTTAYLKDNGIDVEKSGYTLGRKLVLDGERFVGDSDANAMLARDYRDPFVVPTTV